MKRSGFAQIPLMISLLLMAVAVPVATKLVQNNQDNRNKATSTNSGPVNVCKNNGNSCSANGECCSGYCNGFSGYCGVKPTTAPISCGSTNEACCTGSVCNGSALTCVSGKCVYKPTTVPTKATGSCAFSSGKPELANGATYCESPYLLGSRLWTCNNGTATVTQNFLLQRDCKVILPTLSPGGCRYVFAGISETLTNGQSKCYNLAVGNYGSQTIKCTNGSTNSEKMFVAQNCVETLPTLTAGGCRYILAGLNETLTNGQSKCYNLAGSGFLSSTIKCTNGDITTVKTYPLQNCQGILPTLTNGGCRYLFAGINETLTNGQSKCYNLAVGDKLSSMIKCANGSTSTTGTFAKQNCEGLSLQQYLNNVFGPGCDLTTIQTRCATVCSPTALTSAGLSGATGCAQACTSIGNSVCKIIPSLTAGGCRYLPAGLNETLTNGQTKCYNLAVGDKLSTEVKCTNGAASITKYFVAQNCVATLPTLRPGDCRYILAGLDEVIANGDTQCYNLAGSGFLSSAIKCTNGNVTTVGTYPLQNCKAIVVPTIKIPVNGGCGTGDICMPSMINGASLCPAGLRHGSCGLSINQYDLTNGICCGVSTEPPEADCGSEEMCVAGIACLPTYRQGNCSIHVGNIDIASGFCCPKPKIIVPTIPVAQSCPSGSVELERCKSTQIITSTLSNGNRCCKDAQLTVMPTIITVTPKPTTVPACIATSGQYCASSSISCTNAGNSVVNNGGTCIGSGYVCCKSSTTNVPTPRACETENCAINCGTNGMKPTCGNNGICVCAALPTSVPTCNCINGKYQGTGCTDVKPAGSSCIIPTKAPTCDATQYKGEQSVDGSVWLHFDDEYTAKCICGAGAYHYICANDFWGCGAGSTSTSCNSCVESCPNSSQTSLLQSCTPADSDGTSLDRLCNAVGITGSCGGKTYCCPSVGGAWTTDMTKCGGSGKCTQCSALPQAKSKGDADCSAATNINDASIWRSEFISGELGTISKTTWQADFDCDGKVTLNDISIWRDNFIKGL